jgi:hypothetical protein
MSIPISCPFGWRRVAAPRARPSSATNRRGRSGDEDAARRLRTAAVLAVALRSGPELGCGKCRSLSTGLRRRWRSGARREALQLRSLSERRSELACSAGHGRAPPASGDTVETPCGPRRGRRSPPDLHCGSPQPSTRAPSRVGDGRPRRLPDGGGAVGTVRALTAVADPGDISPERSAAVGGNLSRREAPACAPAPGAASATRVAFARIGDVRRDGSPMSSRSAALRLRHPPQRVCGGARTCSGRGQAEGDDCGTRRKMSAALVRTLDGVRAGCSEVMGG